MATRVKVIPTTPIHMKQLADNIRDEDAAEFFAYSGLIAKDTLPMAPIIGETWSVFFNGGLAYIWGVEPLGSSAVLGDVGSIWMLSTTVVSSHPKTFLRTSKIAVAYVKNNWGRVSNVVDSRYKKAIRWLEHIGFDIGEAVYVGPEGCKFFKFSMNGA